MAYAARPHLHYLPAYRKDAGGPSANIEARSDPDDLLRAREAANIQRGIIICERQCYLFRTPSHRWC